MDQEKTEFFRKLLTDRLEALVEEANRSVGDLTEQKLNLPDAIDLATEESNRDFSIRLKDRERKLIYKIKKALERLDDGSYGICEVCGEDIAEKRLIARPATTHCIDCKTEAETQERIRGQ